MIHWCFDCSRYWIFDRFLDSFKDEKDMDKWFKEQGLKIGDSTTKIDKGYRTVTIKNDPTLTLKNDGI